jgi:sugar-specific transcriptional regulator TrmB
MDKNNKISTLLNKLGLTDSEVSIYVYLLERGLPLSVSDIANGILSFRPMVYKAISQLLDKGLITSVVKGKRKQYIAEHPDKLRNMLSEISVDIEETLPDLEDIYRSPKTKPAMKFLEGRKGISFVFADLVDSLKRGDVYYRYSSSRDLEKTNSYLPKDYRKKRDNKNLERYIINSQYVESLKKPNLNRNTRVVPPEFDTFNQNIVQIIYGNKVAVIDINTETAFIIENEQLADFQKKIFRLLYSKL